MQRSPINLDLAHLSHALSNGFLLLRFVRRVVLKSSPSTTTTSFFISPYTQRQPLLLLRSVPRVVLKSYTSQKQVSLTLHSKTAFARSLYLLCLAFVFNTQHTRRFKSLFICSSSPPAIRIRTFIQNVEVARFKFSRSTTKDIINSDTFPRSLLLFSILAPCSFFHSFPCPFLSSISSYSFPCS